MKYIILFILVLFSLSAYSQIEDTPLFVGKYFGNQSGGGAGYWQVTGNFTDESGYYDATSIQIGDILFFVDAGVGYHLPVTSIISASGSSFTIRVNNTGISGVAGVPNGPGGIYRANSPKGIWPFTAGLTASDQQTLNSFLIKRLNNEPVKRDTFITVPHSTNYIPNLVIATPSRFYNNIYISCKGISDTSVVAFLAAPTADHYGVVYNVKNDSGLVETRVLSDAHFSNVKTSYLLRRGQTAQVRALKDQAQSGAYKWAVNLLWDSTATGGGSGITALTGDVTASGTGSVAATIANNAVDSTKAANLSPSDLAQTGASTGQVLTWTGSKYAPRPVSGGSESPADGSLAGIKFAQDGANYNDAWRWNGENWLPTTDGSTPSAFKYHVSPTGNNANSGTPALPKQTIAGLSGLLTTGKTVGLKAGAFFREQLSGTSKFVVGAYDRDIRKPYSTISGAEIHNTGWTAIDNYFQKTITHSISPINGYNNIIVLEIDTAMEKYAPFSAINPMTYVASTSLVNTTPGSYFYTTASPSVVSIHPTSGSPGSNKYRYEVVTRLYSIYGDNGLNISNIWIRGGGHGYGPIAGGDSVRINNVIISGAGTHHFVIKSGDVNNVFFDKVPKGLPTSNTSATFYESNGSGNLSSLSNSIFYKVPNTFIAHTSGAGNHRRIIFDNIWAFGDSTLYPNAVFGGGDQVDTFLFNRIYTDQYSSFGGVAANYITVRNCIFNNASKRFFRFEHPGSIPQLVEIDNIFFKTFAKNGNQSTLNFAGLLYKPNPNAVVRLKNSTLHIKSSWTDAGDNNGGWTGANSVTNSICIAEVEEGRTVKCGNPTVSENNVYILLKGDSFHWTVDPALNGGNPNVTSFATWKAITGLDVNSLFIDLRTNKLGLRAIFVDPDAGNYTLVPDGQYTAQILALKAGMTTPIRGFVPTPTQEECADAVMTSTVPVVLDWKRSSAGTAFTDSTQVKFSRQFTANRIPYTVSSNSIRDTSSLTFNPTTGLTVKGGSNSTGAALSVKNSDNIDLLTVQNGSDISIGRQSTAANTTAVVNLIATDGSNTPTNPGIRLHSNQNGSVSPPNLTWSTYINSILTNIFQIRGLFNSGFLMRSPANSAIYAQGLSVDQTTTVTNSLVNAPVRYPYLEFPQMTYINGGELSLGRDLTAGSTGGDGLLRSGQKNAVLGFDVSASVLTLQAGRGNGAQTSNTGEIRFQTPDGVATGQLQTYSTKMTIKNDGRVGFGVSAPTAYIHTKAGTATANTAPLKFTSGTNLTTPEEGAVEYDGTEFYATNSTASRTIFARVLKGSATLDFGSTAAGAVTDLTITVTGAADGDVVSLSVPNASQTATGNFSAWVSATNTVTVRYRIAALVGSEDPASGTFKVTVTK